MARIADLLQLLKENSAELLRVVPGERIVAKVRGDETDVAAALTASDIRRAASEVVSTDDIDQMSSRPRVVRHEHGDQQYIVELTSHRLGVQLVIRPANAPRPPQRQESPMRVGRPSRRMSRAMRAAAAESAPDSKRGRSPPPRASVKGEPPEEPQRIEVSMASLAEMSPEVVASSRNTMRFDAEQTALLRERAVPAAEAPAAEAPAAEAPAREAARAPKRPATPARTGPARIEKLLREMGNEDASDLHISTGAPPIMRIHGEMRFFNDRPILTSDEVSSLLYEIMPERSAADLDERNDADFAYEVPGLARFRVNAFRDRRGVGAVIRKIPIDVLTAEQLKLPKAVVDLCYLSKGLVLVTGPTGSGKSTTLAALIDFINKNRDDHIITIEDPIEFVHQNQRCLVNQREVGTHTTSFKNALRAALREDPDVVLVGELRDLETIAIAIETAETGHLVFGTLHTSTAMSTVDRVVDQFPPDRQAQIRVMLAGSLRGVVSQVLCKKQGGGRAAALEVLIGSSAVTALVRDGKTHQLASVMQTGKSLGMRTMNDALAELVTNGTVSPQEAYVKAVDKTGLLGMFQAAGIPSPI